MNDMTILHLSDLHIDTSGNNYSRLLHKLIDDIQREIHYVRNNSVIVVVTGDILHQGPLKSENSNAVKHAKEFFNDLYKVLVNKVVGIYIVPGNHDKYRSEKEQFLIPAYRTMKQEYKNHHENLLEMVKIDIPISKGFIACGNETADFVRFVKRFSLCFTYC